MPEENKNSSSDKFLKVDLKADWASYMAIAGAVLIAYSNFSFESNTLPNFPLDRFAGIMMVFSGIIIEGVKLIKNMPSLLSYFHESVETKEPEIQFYHSLRKMTFIATSGIITLLNL